VPRHARAKAVHASFLASPGRSLAWRSAERRLTLGGDHAGTRVGHGQFLDLCYEFDSNSAVCGLGKDNLAASGRRPSNSRAL
jgi:hypothetical protein